MLECSSTLTSAVMSVSWLGPDADALRARWVEVEQQIRATAESLASRAEELAEHASEQDEASSDGGGVEIGSWWERLGLFPPRSGPGDLGSRVSDWLGDLADAAESLLPDGLGLSGPGSGNPFLAALVPGDGPRSPQAKEPYHGEYDNPEDEFDATPGEGGPKSSVKFEGDKGSVELSEDSEGNRTGKVEVSAPLVDAKGKPKGGESSYDLDLKYSGEYKDNGDGTVTYTVSSELSEEAKAAIEAKGGRLPVTASGSSGNSHSSEYQVTVPKGTSLAEAMAINPYDPSSIPPGASVTFANSDKSSAGAEVGIGTLGAGGLSLGAETSNGEGTSTTIGRDSEGNLSVTSGPTSAINSSVTARLGTSDINAHLSQSDSRSETTFETATFEDTPAGRRAYQEALSSGQYPTDTGDGVVETYTEHHETRKVDVSGGMKIGPGSAEKSDNMFTHESITRTYPDGHRETAEQYLPQGDSSTNSVVRSESTGRPPSYVITMDTSEGSDGVESSYGVTPSGDRASVVLSESEAAVVADHARGKGMVPEDASDAEALSILMMNNPDADSSVLDLESNNAVVDSTGRSEPVGGEYSAPGRGFDPDRQMVRDGKIVDKP